MLLSERVSGKLQALEGLMDLSIVEGKTRFTDGDDEGEGEVRNECLPILLHVRAQTKTDVMALLRRVEHKMQPRA